MDLFTKFRFFPFTDPIGRVSDKPIEQENGITDNPLLFTGEACLLLSLMKLLTIKDTLAIDSVLRDCQVVKGLFRRHPSAFQNEYNIPRNKISHDEYNGIMFMVVAIRFLDNYAEDILSYGKNNNWQFNDIHPNSNFFKAFISSPVETFHKLKSYLDDIKKHPEDTNSVDLRHDGDIVAITSLRQPRDVAFYELVVTYNTSYFRLLWLCLSTLITAYSKKDPNSRGGTILLAWFRNIALATLNIKGLKGWIISKTIKLFDKRISKEYTDKYPEVLAEIYWDRKTNLNTKHPMIKLIKDFINFTVDK